jgi:hypothetical protein
MSDEGSDLLTDCFAEGFGAAELDRVGFDVIGIEVVLADHLAEAVADLGSAVVSVLTELAPKVAELLQRGFRRIGSDEPAL